MNDPTTTEGGNEMSCATIGAQDVAGRYLAGTLSESERDAYERHYFECQECFDALRMAGAPLVASPSPAEAARNWWPAWLAAAAVVLVGVWLWPARPAQNGGAPAPQTSAQPGTAAGTPSIPPVVSPAPRDTAAQSPLVELARFAPPPSDLPVLRGPEDEARLLFVAALEHYAHRQYPAAIDGLRRAIDKDPTAPGPRFFVGACLLLTGQTQAGIAELKRTIALGDSPYFEEAHFYLAKGLLQAGDAAAARRELTTMIALDGDHRSEAKQLLSQIDRVRPGR
jgi:tetratricopeptide (TPR) repeat protein